MTELSDKFSQRSPDVERAEFELTGVMLLFACFFHRDESQGQ